MTVAEEKNRLAAAKAAALAKKVKLLTARKTRDEELQELKRRHEEARLKELAGRRAKEEAEERLRKIREGVERRRKAESQVQAKLRDMGVCIAGFRWIK